MIAHRWEKGNHPSSFNPNSATESGEYYLEEYDSHVQQCLSKLENATVLEEVVVRLHDLGKLSPYFQKYIDPDKEMNFLGKLKIHSPLGSIFVYRTVSEIESMDDLDALSAFIAVAKHHGELPNVASYAINDFLKHEGKDEIITKQLSSISDNEEHVEKINSELSKCGVDLTFNQVRDWYLSGGLEEAFSELHNSAFSRVHPCPEKMPERAYDVMLSLWGTLKFADQLGTQYIDTFDTEDLKLERLEEHVNELQSSSSSSLQSELNKTREETRQKVRREAIEKLVSKGEDRVAIRLPTGYGKTITGMTAAIEARNELENTDTVIYSLPYRAIIEQTRELFEGDAWDFKPIDPQYTVHHYRAETRTTREEKDYTHAEQREIAEAWDSEVVLTTFVQLFESLVGPRGSQGTKLNSLKNSVIVIDEPQTIPYEWWKLVDRVCEVLTKQFSAKIIVMTATHPSLVTDTVIPSNTDELYESLPRVRYQVDRSVLSIPNSENEPLSYAEAAGDILESAESGSTMAVCNTVASQRRLYSEVVEARNACAANRLLSSKSPPDGIKVFSLNATMRPIDRKKIIDYVSENAEDEDIILITTQAVEAGVDISFENVYRDIAPLDSIIQAAGRCNREYEWGVESGKVTVWCLSPVQESKDLPATYVYNSVDEPEELVKTVSILTGPSENEIKEEKITNKGVQEFFSWLHQRDAGDKTLRRKVDQALFEDLRDLSLINKYNESVDIIVSRSSEVDEKMKRMRKEFDEGKKKGGYEVMEELTDYRVSISASNDKVARIQKMLSPATGDISEGVFLAYSDEAEKIYDITKGISETETHDYKISS